MISAKANIHTTAGPISVSKALVDQIANQHKMLLPNGKPAHKKDHKFAASCSFLPTAAPHLGAKFKVQAVDHGVYEVQVGYRKTLFTGDRELLTQRGWVKVSDLRPATHPQFANTKMMANGMKQAVKISIVAQDAKDDENDTGGGDLLNGNNPKHDYAVVRCGYKGEPIKVWGQRLAERMALRFVETVEKLFGERLAAAELVEFPVPAGVAIEIDGIVVR